MQKFTTATVRKAWKKPEVKKIDAGSAEAVSDSGIDDGGPVGQARS